MTLHHKMLPATMEMIGDRQVRVRCSTGGVDRAGDIVVQDGADLTGYRTNPVMLWQHNPDVPVARALECGMVGGELQALADFPPAGISPKADEICGLAKAQIINAVSIGFDVIEAEPMDPKRPRGAQRFLKWELMEISFVSVPANRDALVIARQFNQQKAAMPLKIKGLYDVGQLAYLMAQLGYATSEAEWETEIEGDASKVPAMLGAALRQIGDTLIAMTQEEVAELLANHDTPDVQIDDNEFVTAGKTPEVQRFRRGIERQKARPAVPVLIEKTGKKISAATAKALQTAQDMHGDAATMHEKAAKMSSDACDMVKSMLDDADASDDEDDNPDATADTKLSQASRLKTARLLAVSPA